MLLSALTIILRTKFNFFRIMKHRFLILALILLSTLAHAQDQNTLIKAGINFSNLNSESKSFSSRISFHAGIGIETSFNDTFSLAPEVLFSSQGAKVKNGSQRELRLNYINLPVMFRYYPADGFYLEAGPQAGILVSARQSAQSQYDSDISNVKGQDYGFNIGLGYKSDTFIGINARYYFGFRDINELEFGENTKNGVFQISLNFYLN